MKKQLAIVVIFSLTGCNEIAKLVTPDTPRLVTADGKVYMACKGKIDVLHDNSGYSVHLIDRDWNDTKTTHTDTDVYFEAKEVTVRAMTPDEINICKAGHFLPVSQAPTTAGDDDCYDSNGNLMPNDALTFKGSLVSCGAGKTRKPRSERTRVPAAWRSWVEEREACDKAVVDSGHTTKEAFDSCRAKAEASRPTP
jgi:hypothetical protein